MGKLSEAAQAARLIRKELKKNFPKTKFRVRTEHYAAGDSVDIVWTEGPHIKAVRKITDKYLKDYSKRKDIPKAKFITHFRKLSDEKAMAVLKEHNIKIAPEELYKMDEAFINKWKTFNPYTLACALAEGVSEPGS